MGAQDPLTPISGSKAIVGFYFLSLAHNNGVFKAVSGTETSLPRFFPPFEGPRSTILQTIAFSVL